MEEGNKRNPTDEQKDQRHMPTVFSKLYNQRNIVIENFNTLEQVTNEKLKIGHKNRKNIIEYCKILQKHCTGKEHYDLNLVISCEVFNKPIGTPWMNHLRQI